MKIGEDVAEVAVEAVEVSEEIWEVDPAEEEDSEEDVEVSVEDEEVSEEVIGKTSSQHAECDLSKIEKTFNGTLAGWKSMHQGLRKYFVWNPRSNTIEPTS